jgi:hypothetical protein
MVQGFADTHNHQFANLGFGGKMFYGSPLLPVEAFGWCTPAHGLAGTYDKLGNIVRTMHAQLPASSLFGHLVGGYPQFDGWPRWDSFTHQAVHKDWLKRAVDGGLRLMVMLAVNSEFLAGLVERAPGRTALDMEAVDMQIGGALLMEQIIDAESGGPGRGWYRIVRTPAEAEAVIAAGKLAVVLGIEVDYLFNSYPGPSLTSYPWTPLTPDQLVLNLDKYYQLGVRHIYPIHFADNLFGGASFDKALL